MKKRQKLPVRKEKVQSCCIWRLVDIFDFRNGGSNRKKLLTNGRKMVKKDVSDLEHPRKVHIISSSCREKNYGFEENLKTVMKENFAASRKLKKQKKASKKLPKSSDFEFVNELQDHKTPSKLSNEDDQVHIQLWDDKFLMGPEQPSCSAEISVERHNLETMCEEICSQIYQEKICRGGIQKVITPLRFNERDQVDGQLLQITAKAFIDWIYINGKDNYEDGVSSKSKYFSDASEILNLNMDLFLKLLQDPSSLLLKSIQNLPFPLRDKERMKLYLDSRPLECSSSGTRNYGDPKDAMKIQRRNSNNPFWKRLKDRYGCSSKVNTTPQASNKIVILKPGPKSKQNPGNVSCHCSSLQVHQNSKNKMKNFKSTSFSFKDIKRKFKQAVGENQQKQHLISMDESLRRLAQKKKLLKDADKRNNSCSGKGKSTLSPDAKRMEKQEKLVDLASGNRSKIAPSAETLCKTFNSSTSSCSKQRQNDIFIEAKRHLSERLRNVHMGEIVSRRESTRTLKMILSSPEHDFLTTHSSDIYSIKDDYEPSGSTNTFKAKEDTLRSSNILELPYELNSIDDANDTQCTEITKEYKESGYMESSNLNFPSENHPLGSSSSLNVHELEIMDTPKYKEEHASPVSVLEPFSPEYFSSPTSITDESLFQPRRIDFDDYSQVVSPEDTKVNASAYMDVEESIHFYVRAVMEALDLSFDQISLKESSAQDVLYTCIADTMGLQPVESYTELQLLFDCIHEVLLGMYEHYSGCPPWLSFLKQKITPVHAEKEDMVDEVVKEVNFYLLPKMEQPTLNQLVEKDIIKSGSWLDLFLDTEDILIQIAEDVLQDSIEDTILEAQI